MVILRPTLAVFLYLLLVTAAAALNHILWLT